jgi:hypothetical protein
VGIDGGGAQTCCMTDALVRAVGQAGASKVSGSVFLSLYLQSVGQKQGVAVLLLIGAAVCPCQNLRSAWGWSRC